MIDELTLLSGNDIPFAPGQVNIHQPTLKEIAYIGEEAFFTGCHLLNFSKGMLETQGKVNLDDLSNFEILMSIVNDTNNPSAKQQKVNMLMVLTLLFPEHEIEFFYNEISLTKSNFEKESFEKGFINKDNFEEFKQIIKTIFGLGASSASDEYNPQGDLAKKIAKKLDERRKKLAKQKGGDGQKIAIFSRYISILTVGENKDMNSLFNLTVYQLLDEFQRYELKMSFDYHLQAKMAGAKDLKDVDDWMKDIHS